MFEYQLLSRIFVYQLYRLFCILFIEFLLIILVLENSSTVVLKISYKMGFKLFIRMASTFALTMSYNDHLKELKS